MESFTNALHTTFSALSLPKSAKTLSRN